MSWHAQGHLSAIYWITRKQSGAKILVDISIDVGLVTKVRLLLIVYPIRGGELALILLSSCGFTCDSRVVTSLHNQP